MYITSYPKALARRCRLYLFRVIVISFCVCLFLQIKYGGFHLISKKSVKSVSIRANLSLIKLILDCTGDPLERWCQNRVELCDPNLIVYDNLFVETKEVILQPKFAKGKRIGGENIQDVLNQPEDTEYFQFEKHFIKLPCYLPNLDEKLPEEHLADGFASLTSYKTYKNVEIVNETTIAICRQDYVNFYHTMTDLYTTYLLCRFFRQDPKSVRILFIDAHPKGNLDIFWSQLFHSYTRLGHLKNVSSILYRQLIWAQPQQQSEIDISQLRKKAPSYLSDFREHVLKQFDIDYQTNPQLNCQSLKIFFLVRHNYVAHPRNPSGKIGRRLPDERQILKELKMKFSEYSNINFTWNHFEELSIAEQLKIIIETDIFVGIHGAGLTHVLFLKSNRILIELLSIPRGVSHFDLLASMNNVIYQRCLINVGSVETTKEIYDCITKKLVKVCPSVTLSPILLKVQR